MKRIFNLFYEYFKRSELNRKINFTWETNSEEFFIGLTSFGLFCGFCDEFTRKSLTIDFWAEGQSVAVNNLALI